MDVMELISNELDKNELDRNKCGQNAYEKSCRGSSCCKQNMRMASRVGQNICGKSRLEQNCLESDLYYKKFLGSYKVVFATSFFERCKGFLGVKHDDAYTKDNRRQNCVLCLIPCRSIHTFGMKFDIDVLFVDTKGKVLHSERNLGRRHFRSCKNARFVFERPSSPNATWPCVGDRIEMVANKGDDRL